MTSPALIRALIPTFPLERILAELDADPRLLRAWTDCSWMALAARRGKTDLLEALYQRGLGVNDVGTDGLPPLWWGVDYPEVVAWLLERGADASAPGVMVSAAGSADVATVRKLLAAGGDIVVRTGRPPRNAYEQARMMGRPQEILKLLGPPLGNFDPLRWLEARLGPLTVRSPPLAPAGTPFQVLLGTGKQCVVCTTLGLSDRSLPGLDYRAEVMVRLPAQYPKTIKLGRDPRWPVDWLISVARAALDGPVMRPLDTIGNGEPATRLSPDVPFVGSISIDEEHDATLVDGSRIKLFSLIPLHPAELALARRDPLDLIQAFEDAALPDEPVVKATRPSAVHR